MLVQSAGVACLLLTVVHAALLDPTIEKRLLRSGRPQIGLWKALRREAESKAAGPLALWALYR